MAACKLRTDRNMNTTPSPRRAAGSTQQRLRRGAVMAAVLCTSLVMVSAWADSKGDHERARAAVQAGEILPLPTLLERLQRSHPGHVLELELEREDGRWIYEIKLLQSDGKLLELELDAGTAEVLKVNPKEPAKGKSQ